MNIKFKCIEDIEVVVESLGNEKVLVLESSYDFVLLKFDLSSEVEILEVVKDGVGDFE